MNAAASTSELSDKLVDRGRVNFWVQHIGRLLNKSVKKLSVEDLQQIKGATGKLLLLLQQTEKTGRDAFLKQHLAIDTLITVLQIVSCEQTVSNIINIFIEVVGKAHPAKRASVLVNHGLTTVLFQILKLAHTNDTCLSDDVLISIHVLLSRIGHKDCKFAVRARLHQSLILTLNLVKTHFHNFRNLQPLLQVMKLYTNNSVNASYLGKHNSVNIMLKVIVACGKRHTVDLKLALENLCNLTRSKSNSARLISLSGIPQLLAHHSEWQRLDTKHRHLTIRRCILHILKNITELKAGRAAFVEADGIRILYEGTLEASDCRDMESLILLASVILRKCCPRNKLPLESSLSPLLFPLPVSNTHTPECYYLTNFPVPRENVQGSSAAGDSDHSSLDDDEEDDVDSDDERFRNDPEERDEDLPDGPEPAEFRTLEDLRMYDSFFPELFEQQFQQAVSAPPTLASVLQRSASAFSRRSSGLSSDALALKHNSCGAGLNRRISLDFITGSSCSYPKQYSQCLSGLLVACERGNEFEEKPVNAINLKTGSSVITLDMGSNQSPTAFRSSKSASKVKQRRKATAPKERSSSGKASYTSLEESLSNSFSSLSFSSQECDQNDQEKTASFENLDPDFCSFIHDPALYAELAGNTHSVYKFQKLPFPDMYGAKGPSVMMEPLSSRRFGVQRAKIFEDIERMIQPENLLDEVVYDLDKIITENAAKTSCNSQHGLTNKDELRAGHIDENSDALKFSAEFESGNLRKVVRVRQYEYDLILRPDVNSNHHHQWFYFEVSNMEADKPYRFNIVNCEKLNSQFNFGMQPLMMSVIDAMHGSPCWARVGTDICYYKNHFIRNSSTTGGVQGKAYFTATFTVTFEHSGDICYISYHYPYTYTSLQTHLRLWELHCNSNQIFFRNQSLCMTLGSNSVPVLTITAQPRTMDRDGVEEMRSRPYVFLSGRVHPGESNASWIMKGTIDFLLSRTPQAQQVRERYIFKIVPMLNPDGVINGNHRSSLVGEDLNRHWGKPCHVLHPTIYHTKGLLQYLSLIGKTPMVYCDYHGHSRRKNIFLYGCSPNQTWIANDTQNPACSGIKPTDLTYKQLPRLLHANCSSFCLKNCSYVVEKGKENTARVVVWRHIGVVRSYTMESSYCGCDQGRYKDMQMNTAMLEEMGHKFCETLLKLATQKGGYDQQMPVFDQDQAVGGELNVEDFEDDLDDSSKKESNVDSQLDDSDLDDDGGEDEEEEFDDDV